MKSSAIRRNAACWHEGRSMEMKRKCRGLSPTAKAKNVIDVISYVYRQQMEREQGMVGVVFYEEIHRMPRVVKFLQE